MTRPFYSGTQFADWQISNCYRCTKAPQDQDSWPECPIYAALLEAYVGNGEVDNAIATRMNYTPDKYNWMCSEWEPTEAWKAEWYKRHSEE